MNEKMTSGEIAKKAGISQKAIRLYDEKGLLKPVDYSEGNYRLYDNESLLVLEKIIALKQIGFSLEEIRDNLVGSKETDILLTLQEQIDMMEAKRYELERAISRMKAVIARSNGKPNWDDVADILRGMQLDQNSDDGHFFALDHTKDELDWYIKIYRSLNVKAGERVLDIGCGYAKVWRNNWEDIPQDVIVDGYDLRGSWADDFEKFVEDNKKYLVDGTNINLFFEDVEDDNTWTHIEDNAKYSMIIAHYVTYELKDAEKMIERASKVLADDGVMSLNVFGNMQEARIKFWIDIFKRVGLDTKLLEEELEIQCIQREAYREKLKKYFSVIDSVVIPCNFSYENIDDLAKDLEKCLENHIKYYENNIDKIKKSLASCFEEGLVVPHDETFWRLRK